MDQSSRNDLLNKCLTITGQFEGGGPTLKWDNIAGDFDQQGMSVGVLQFAALQGSLSRLCSAMIRAAAEMNSPIPVLAADINDIATLNGVAAKAYVYSHYLDGKGNVLPDKKELWRAVLRSGPGVHAQMELADKMYFEKAIALATEFVPTDAEHLRVLSFFFDVVTQSGGMRNKTGSVKPIQSSDDACFAEAIAFAAQNSKQTADYWQQVVDGGDELTKVLLHYAYRRAQLSRPAYVWDACSRRGAIAARGGVVHKHFFDFTEELP